MRSTPANPAAISASISDLIRLIRAKDTSRTRNLPSHALKGVLRNGTETVGNLDAEASEQARSCAVAWLFGFQLGTWAQSWAHFLKSCPYSARSQSPPHRSVTALAPETASPAPSPPCHRLNHAEGLTLHFPSTAKRASAAFSRRLSVRYAAIAAVGLDWILDKSRPQPAHQKLAHHRSFTVETTPYLHTNVILSVLSSHIRIGGSVY